MSFIKRIPPELVVKIILSCDWTSMFRLSWTCKTYHKLITSSSAIQLEIELQSNDFQLTDEAYRAGSEGAAVRLLHEFKRYRDGWLYLQMGKPFKLAHVDVDMRLYELRQGFYAAALSSTHALPDIVKLIHLSTGSARLLSLGLQFSEFQIDPSQELMVLVAIEDFVSDMATVHLRSFLGGSPHSGTQYPDWKVQLPFPMYRRSSGIFVEVMDELLAVKYTSFDRDTNEVLVWNWRSAVLLNRIQISGPSCTFGFLTTNSLLVFCSASVETPAVRLLVYRDIRTPRTLTTEQPGYYRIFEYEPLAPSVEFGFPAFPDTSMAHLLLRGEPAPTVNCSGSAMFVPRPQARVLQLSMTVIQNQERGLSQYQIFISKEKLLKHISSADEHTGLQQPIKIPWDDWGEFTTRWFGTRSAVSPWICRAYGTRFIQSSPFGDDDENVLLESISILDFHPVTVRRFSSLGRDAHLSLWKSKDARRHIDLNSADEDIEYVLNALRAKQDSSIYEDDQVFVDTIDEDVPSETPFNGNILRTRLPYRIVTRIQPVPKHSGWMIDNNLIIGMPGDDMENIQHEHINVYTPFS